VIVVEQLVVQIDLATQRRGLAKRGRGLPQRRRRTGRDRRVAAQRRGGANLARRGQQRSEAVFHRLGIGHHRVGARGRLFQHAVQLGGQAAALLDAIGKHLGGLVGGGAQVRQPLLGAGGGHVQLLHGGREA